MKASASFTSTLAATALFGLTCLLAWQHRNEDEGLSASEIEAATIAQERELGQDGRQLLLDLVEPEQGEGGSEAELRALVDSLDLHAEPAGFYSEGEHLWRVHGDPQQLAALEAELADHPLVEGVEADLTYALPAEALVGFSTASAPSSRFAQNSPTAAPDHLPEDLDIAKPDRPRFVPDDPMYPLQWHLDAIHVPEAWMHTRGRGAVVAVIDTGVAYKNLRWKNIDAKAVPDLAGIEMVDGQTFVDNSLPDGLDDHAHGTHVAGTIAQATDNGIGVAGVAHHAKIMPLKVLAGDGRGSVAAIANAIRWAADHDADVINMSLGGPMPSRVMAKAIEYAHQKGVTVVCAAGNEKRSKVSYPAAYEHSVAVAATDWEGKRSFYSNWGKQLDVSAPGGDTRADKNGDGHPDGVLQNTIRIQDPAHNDYLWFQGTSMASPHAAGVAALIVAQGVTNPDEVERVMKETAKHPNGKKWDQEYGAGIIDAEQAVIAARKTYEGERLGFAGLIGLMATSGLGLAGIGATALTRGSMARRTAIAGAGLLGGAGLALGAVCTPLAYAFGVGLAGSGVLLSALVPLLAVLTLLQVKPLRSVLIGLSLGWAALLAHGAVVLPTLIEGIPGGAGWDRAWLAINAVACALLARKVGEASNK